MDSFINKFCARYNIETAEAEKLFSMMESRTFRNHEALSDKSANNEHLFYIVTKGNWRAYRMIDGEEQTLWLICEGDIVLVPAEGYIIDSISESQALCISKPDLDKICEQSHIISDMVRVLFEHQYTATLNWLLYLCLPSAEERYRAIMENEPELLQQVPLKYIASYLGVTPQSLSRIRRNI